MFPIGSHRSSRPRRTWLQVCCSAWLVMGVVLVPAMALTASFESAPLSGQVGFIADDGGQAPTGSMGGPASVVLWINPAPAALDGGSWQSLPRHDRGEKHPRLLDGQAQYLRAVLAHRHGDRGVASEAFTRPQMARRLILGDPDDPHPAA